MPHTVVLEDDGFFVLAAYFNSVTHPPGYPLFVMVAHVFTWLPVGSVAFKVHLASACFGALACVCTWYLARCLLEGRLYAYIAALGLGLSKTFWSQAIIAEVYTLNVLLFLLLFVFALQCSTASRENYGFYCKWFAFIYGLALCNHWPLIMLSTPALLVLLWLVRSYLFRNLPKLLPFLLAGLLPYLWLIWRSHVVPEYSFFGPIQTWGEFWFYVSRQLYAGFDYSITAGWMDKLGYTGFVLRETSAQLVVPGILLVIAGFLWQWKVQPVIWSLAMLLAYLGSTILLILLRNADYDLYNQAVFQVYPLISYLMAVMWAAYGVRFFVERIVGSTQASRNRKLAGGMVVLLILAGTFIVNAPENYRKQDYLAAEYAATVLDSLERGAVFYANADNIDGPIRYLHAVEGRRPDVTVFTGRYLYFNNKIYRPYRLAPGNLKNLVNEYISGTDRPVYFTNDFPNDYATDRYGFYKKINRQRAAGERVIIEPGFLAALSHWREHYRLENEWDIMHFNLVLADFCELILAARYPESSDGNGILKRYENHACNNYQGILKRLKFALDDTSTDRREIGRLLELADRSESPPFTKKERAELAYYRGMFYLREENIPLAMTSLAKSIDIWPHPENPARQVMGRLQPDNPS